jgi:hypothetical protein
MFTISKQDGSLQSLADLREANSQLGECLSGSWYNHAWDEMEKDGICDFMIPIILYIDKTQVSVSGKLTIYPVQMTLGIFTV